MAAVEKLLERYEIGKNVLNELFKLSDSELKEKIKSICGDRVTNYTPQFFDEVSGVTRIIVDERPYEITFNYFDCIMIDAWGIKYLPEHGEGEILVEFNDYFKL